WRHRYCWCRFLELPPRSQCGRRRCPAEGARHDALRRRARRAPIRTTGHDECPTEETSMSNPIAAPEPLAEGALRVIPLGGLGEIGRNMTTFEYDGKILIVDCGVLFPEEHQPGVD